MGPQLSPKLHFIQCRDTDTIRICRNMLCYDVHRCLSKEEIHSNAGCCCNSRGLEYIQDDFLCQFPGRKLVDVQIICDIQKDLIDRIGHDVFWCDVLQIDLVDAGAVLDIISHARRGDQEVQSKGRILLQRMERRRGPFQSAPRCCALSPDVDFPDFLVHFK